MCLSCYHPPSCGFQHMAVLKWGIDLEVSRVWRWLLLHASQARPSDLYSLHTPGRHEFLLGHSLAEPCIQHWSATSIFFLPFLGRSLPDGVLRIRARLPVALYLVRSARWIFFFFTTHLMATGNHQNSNGYLQKLSH